MRSISVLRFCFVLLFLSQCLAKSVSNNENIFNNQRIKRNEPNDDENDNKDDNEDNEESTVTDIEDITTTDDNNDDKSDEDVKDTEDDDEDHIIVDEEQLSDVSQEGVKLLIILVDGFRYDYVSLDKSLKGFPKIAQNGVSAKYVKPIFPTKSYPNWYTIVTGLYAESHGMFGNYMYDKTRDDLFLMSPHPNVSHTHFWNQTEPLWITAQKNGINTAMYLWDGCQVKIDNTRPYICHKYRALYDEKVSDNETRTFINTILEDFSNDKYRLALLYYEFVDHIGHTFGPRSRKNKNAIRGIDDILNDLYESIEERQLNNELNVVIVSDHGMISVENSKFIYLEKILDFNDVDIFLGGGPLAQILPEEGKEEVVYQQLRQSHVKGLNVYRKENIPERFHYKNDNNVLPLLLTADEGYLIHAPRIKSKVYPDYDRSDSEPPSGGNHGFDPDYVEEMRAIMYGFGPAFRKNYTSEPLSQVDHYNLFCHILGINAKPNNGSLHKMEKLLKEAESEEEDDDNSEEDEEAAEQTGDDEDDDEDDGVADNHLHSILILWITFQFFYLTYNKIL